MVSGEPARRATSPAALFASWFGAGYLPKMPGTWGSLAALPFAWVIFEGFGSWGLAAAGVGLFFIGWVLSARLVRLDTVSDPQWIVIDEVAALWLTLAFAGREPLAWIVGFASFRLADTLKPFPAGWADRNVGGGLGVMLDDMLAVLYSGTATWVAAWLLGAGR